MFKKSGRADQYKVIFRSKRHKDEAIESSRQNKTLILLLKAMLRLERRT